MWTLGIVATIIVGLIVDQLVQPYGQYIVNTFVIGIFSLLIFQTPKPQRKKWWACLVLASLGEVVLSEAYGMYEYREGSIPLFVPPGHVLLYAAGLWVSEYVHKSIPWITLIAGTCYSFYCFSNEIDQISVVLFLLWVLIFFRAELRPLITAMLLMALSMELLGTGLGNWIWVKEVPFFHFTMTQANPPFAVGVLYCGLDFLVGLFAPENIKQ